MALIICLTQIFRNFDLCRTRDNMNIPRIKKLCWQCFFCLNYRDEEKRCHGMYYVLYILG